MERLGTIFVSALFFDYEVFGHTVEELRGGETVEIFHHTVVVDDVKMRSGESHGKEIVIFLFAGMRGIGLGFLMPHQCCCC